MEKIKNPLMDDEEELEVTSQRITSELLEEVEWEEVESPYVEEKPKHNPTAYIPDTLEDNRPRVKGKDGKRLVGKHPITGKPVYK